MDYFSPLYKNGLPQLDNEVSEILKSLDQGENICLCSAPKMGDNMLIDYVAYKLRKHEKYEVVYNSQNEIDFKSIREKIQRKEKTVLILIPWLHNPIDGFYRDLEMLFLDAYEGGLKSVIRLHFNFLVDPKKYFSKSIRPVSNVIIRKPFPFKFTKEMINQRRIYNRWLIPEDYEEEIHNLSGGIPGIIKRLCSYVNTHGNLDIEGLCVYPPIAIELSEFQELFQKFPNDVIFKMGLIDEKGNIISSLIERVVNQDKCEERLSPQLKQVFNLLKKNKGRIVSLEEIGDRIDPHEFSLWKTYKSIERLKQNLPKNYFIRNIKGKGYILREK